MFKSLLSKTDLVRTPKPPNGRNGAGEASPSSPVDTWQRFNLFAALRRSKTMEKINSEKTFREILRRERARSDRNGHGFSLVTFQLDALIKDEESLRRLVGTLTERLRMTDVIGLCDRQRVGVLLYDTSSEGAKAFARKIHQAMDDAASQPRSNVFTYPTDWIVPPPEAVISNKSVVSE